MKNRLRKLMAILRIIRENRLPFFPTLALVIRNLREKKVSLSIMAYTPYLLHPERPIALEDTFMSLQENIRRAVDVNDLSLRAVVREKIHLFTRLGAYMGRAALDMSTASDGEIEDFLRRWGTVVGKKNLAAGSGFKIYSAEKGDTAAGIRADEPALLEVYIRQHPAYRAIYPDSVNTIRIQTVRNSRGVYSTLLPKFRVGADGSVIDIPNKVQAYRLILSEKGRILGAFLYDWKKGAARPVSEHRNTHYRFRHGKKLPCVEESIRLCEEAALLLPEYRYLGWDVAVTGEGPVVVETNDIPGSWNGYQSCRQQMTWIGARFEAERQFSLADEGVRYDWEDVFCSEPFVQSRPEFPSIRELYLIYLQTALHRHGVEFAAWEEELYPAPPRRHDCAIRCDRENDRIRIEMNGACAEHPLSWREVLPEGDRDPDASGLSLPRELFYALDRSAMAQAALIYQDLVLGCDKSCSREGLAAYARFCSRLNTVYLWSGLGQLMSQAVLDQVNGRYPDHCDRAQRKRYAGLTGGNAYAFDCSGLIKSYYFGGLGSPLYDESRDWNSNTLYARAARKGPLSTLPEEPGLCVYRENHVGVYVGDGRVVDASPSHGEMGGVQAAGLDTGGWTDWFECPL